ncbi:MAG TPA: LuxR C-terminal-related transcriptional regulator [Marmoricola sp.]|nr:LuxR C-terminal-related transcriptional regulator [Marmoricola sp.]
MIADPGTPRLAGDVVPRSRLLDRLDRLLPLTVLRAPRGFGRTTLAAQWFAGLDPDQALWVSIEDDRASAAAFWDLVADVLLARGHDVAERGPDALRALLEGPGHPWVLVVDDLDRVADPEVVATLLQLLRRYPRLHLLATGSADVLDHSSWLDLDGQVIGAEELAFDATEQKSVLAALGVAVDDADALESQLAGWPLAIRAFGLALRTEEPDEALHTVRDQLGATVLTELGSGLDADLVLVTALIGDARHDQLGHLLDGPGRAHDVDRLVARGLMVAEGEGSARRLRWPGVVRDVVLTAWTKTAPGDVRRARQELATRFEGLGEYGRALEQATAAEDWAVVRALIEGHFSPVFMEHPEALRAVVIAAPPGALGDSILIQAIQETYFFDPVRAAGLRRRIPDERDAVRAMVAEQRPALLWDHLTILMALFRLRADYASAVDVARKMPLFLSEAVERYPDDPVAHGPGVSLQCGLTWLHVGDHRQAVAEFERCYRHAEKGQVGHFQRDAASKLALLHGFLGEHPRSRAWAGRAEDAPFPRTWATPFINAGLAAGQVFNAVAALDREAALAAVEELELLHPRDELWVLLHYARAKVAVLWGHPAATLRELESAVPNGVPVPSPAMADLLLATRVDLNLARGLGARCAGLLEDSASTSPLLQVRRARLALLTGDAAAAVGLARAAAEHHHAAPSTDLEALVVEAVALHRLDDPNATARFAEALAVAGRRSDAFALVPRADLDRLGALVPGAQAMLDDPRLAGVGAAFPSEVSFTELTQRERVVLQHLADGVTLQAIAHRETVSINTVKSQVLSIYRKLGASDRKHALESAAREGLI